MFINLRNLNKIQATKLSENGEPQSKGRYAHSSFWSHDNLG